MTEKYETYRKKTAPTERRVQKWRRLWYAGTKGEMTMDARTTGELIAARRRALGLSQGELAERLHVTDKAVSKWETGRGMPAIDSLEPLAEVLGLSVSELLSGRELTAAELPKAAGGQIVESMRRGWKMAWRGALAAVLTLALVGGGYIGWHYYTSAFFENKTAADREALRKQAEEFLHMGKFAAEGRIALLDLEQRGNYLAALCVEEDSSWDLCVYDRDRIFQDRWRITGGVQGPENGTIRTWDFGSPQGESVIVFGGWGLPAEIAYYSFQNGGITYICPTNAGGMLLDVFVTPTSYDITPHDLILLDEEHQTIPYRDSWNPEEYG